MAINLKEFEENEGKVRSLKSTSKILDLLKSTKKAYTVKEISEIIYPREKNSYIKTNTLMQKLKASGKVLHKSPYYAYNFKKKKENEIQN